jgi:ATP-binding cassette subfamily C (CFTR/MRP) protein 1
LTFLALQLSILIRYSTEFPGVFGIQLFSHIVSSIAALAFCVLSVVEHRRSATPSTLLVLYILACAFGNASELLIMPPKHNNEALYFLFVPVSLELAILVTECQSKDSILLPQYQQLTPEERAGILGRTFFWWINPILMKGHRSILADADLPRTGEKLSSSKMRANILRSWNQRGLRSSESPNCFVSMTNFN